MAFNDIYVDGTRVMMGGPQPNNCSLLLSSDSLIRQFPSPLGQGYDQTILWTYSGANEFLGLATTSGATTPTYAINTIIDANMSDDYPSTFYSVVVQSPAVIVTYGNTSVGTLAQLGQKMRIPSTTLTQDGTAYYLDDIKIECNPTSGNQVRCSYWDPYQSDYADIFATEDAVTQVLDVADQLVFGPIMITYEEVPDTTFTIDGTTYDVDANTAYWYEWVNSSYAPSGSGIETDPTSSTYFVHLGGTASNYGIFYNGSLQSPSDEIIIGRAYTTGAAYEQHDLTGTTWLFYNNYTDMNGPWDYATYNINFTSNNTNYTSLGLDTWTIYYNNTMAFAPGPPQWYNQAYRTISITGGADATNAALYAFISANATQTGGQ